MIYKVRPDGMCNIYLFVFPDGFLYVGYCTGHPEKRWKKGKGYPNNTELQKAIARAGGLDNVKKYILVSNVPDWLVWKFEQYFIKLFNCQWPNGYNKDSGGKKGFTRCQQTKDKISAALMGRNGKPIAKIDLDTGEVITVYPSKTQASVTTGIDLRNICKVCSGHRKNAGGYDWKLIDNIGAAD